MPIRVVRFTYVVLLGLAMSAELSAVAATSPANQADIAASYSLTRTGFGSADRITEPGTIYTVRREGLLARAIADHFTPTNVITADGQLVPPAKGFRAAFGASGDVLQVEPGARFYLHAVEMKDNAVEFTLLSLDSMTVVGDGGSVHSRLRMYLKFDLDKAQRDTLTLQSVHKLTDPVFAPANSAPTVKLGQSLEEVHEALGAPDQVVDLGAKQILVYKSLKITMVDGKVTDAQ